MKKVYVTLLTALSCLAAHAQQKTSTDIIEEREHIPSFFISGSTGINNNTGLFGLSFEKPFGKETFVSWSAGAGISTWGLKTMAEAKCYFGSYQQAWAIACGVTFNTGYPDYRAQMYSTYPGLHGHSYQPVTLTLLPQGAGYIAAYYYYPLGDKVRVFAELGWSVCFTKHKVNVTSGDPIDETSQEYNNLILFYAPGGPIMAGGLSFSVR